MPRGLDHLVHVVRDLDAAGAFYQRLGFTVGARNRHPWGTHTRIVQLPGFFIELLTVGEGERILPPAPGTISFAAFTRDFLARGEGLAMLVLEGKNAEADVDAFRRAGIGDFAPFRFEREGRTPALRAAAARPRHVLLHLPAALSRELLEPGVPGARQRRDRHWRHRAGRGKPERPSHFSLGPFRRARPAFHLGWGDGGNPTRRDPGHGPCGLSPALRGGAAGHARRRAARRGNVHRTRRCGAARVAGQSRHRGEGTHGPDRGRTGGRAGRNARLRCAVS